MSSPTDRRRALSLPLKFLPGGAPFNSFRGQVTPIQKTRNHPLSSLPISNGNIPLDSSGGPAPSTSMARIDGLPLEILRIIFSSLPKSDLKKLRYMHKALSEAVVPSLFNQVIFAPSELDMEIAKNVLGTFGRHVTHLVLVSVNYRTLTFNQYRDMHQRRHGNYRTASKEDEKTSYDVYETLCLWQKNIEQDHDDVVFIRRALIAAPSIRTIEINDRWPSDAVQAFYRNLTLNQHCGSRDSPWDFPVLCPKSGYEPKHYGSIDAVWIRPLTIVAQALEAVDRQIHTFRISHAGAFRLPLKALHHLRSNIGDQYRFFCYLRSLDLQLGVQDYRGTFEKPAGLVNLLKTATNLETLNLSFDEAAAHIFRAVAAKVQFPALKHLSLENCTADEEFWIKFFQNHEKTLRTLVGVHLTVDEFLSSDITVCGKWENVLWKGMSKVHFSNLEVRELWQGSMMLKEGIRLVRVEN